MDSNVQPVLEVGQIRFSYGDYEAVKGISFNVHAGEVFGLLGTNGAGKTTTIEMLQGLRKPTSGKIRVFGKEPWIHTPHTRRRTGIVLQEAGFFLEMSVKRTLEWWGKISGRNDQSDRLLTRCGLAHRSHEAVSALSGGERRRLDLALALWGRPELLILDEPTTGLDAESRRGLWGIIKEECDRGTAVILTTHYLDEAENLCSRLAIMHRGQQVVAGNLDDIRDTSRVSGFIRIEGIIGPRVATFAESNGIATVRSGSNIEFLFDKVQVESVSRLVAEIEGCTGGSITAMSVTPRTLEEIFLSIAQNTGTINDEG